MPVFEINNINSFTPKKLIMETKSKILSQDILSEMEALQICGGQVDKTDSPEDTNTNCGDAKCGNCGCTYPIKTTYPGCSSIV